MSDSAAQRKRGWNEMEDSMAGFSAPSRGFQLDPRLVQLQADLMKAEEERQQDQGAKRKRGWDENIDSGFGGPTVVAPAGMGPTSPIVIQSQPVAHVPGYKTQLCKFFPIGQCQKGDGCTYAHGEYELAVYPNPGMRGAPCISGVAPPSIGAPGLGQFAFPEAGFAASAVAPEANAVAAMEAKQMAGYKTQPCKFYALGCCQKGEACSFVHDASMIMPGGSQLASTAASAAPAMTNPQAGASVLELMQMAGFGMAPQAAAGEAPLNDQFRFKTLPCKFYPMGMCTKGDACTYIHQDNPQFAAVQNTAVQNRGNIILPPTATPAFPGIPPVSPRPKIDLRLGGKGPAPMALPASPAGMSAPFFLNQPSAASNAWQYNQRPCKYFPLGMCNKGDSCSFAHYPQGVGELNQTPQVQPANMMNAQRECKFFKEGWCRKGAACDFAHIGGQNPANNPANIFAATGVLPQPVLSANELMRSVGRTGPDPAFKTQMCKFYPLGACTKGEFCKYAHGEEQVRQYGKDGLQGTVAEASYAQTAQILAMASGGLADQAVFNGQPELA